MWNYTVVYMSCKDGLVGSSLKEQYFVGYSYTCYYLLISALYSLFINNA